MIAVSARRLQFAVSAQDRARATRAACRVARVGLEYVLDDRDAIEHGISVVEWFCAGQASLDGVRASQQNLTGLATRADRSEDRAAWHAVEAVVALASLVLAPMPDLASKQAWRVATATIDAMTHPDHDEAAMAQADLRLRAVLTEALGPEERYYLPK